MPRFANDNAPPQTTKNGNQLTNDGTNELLTVVIRDAVCQHAQGTLATRKNIILLSNARALPLYRRTIDK